MKMRRGAGRGRSILAGGRMSQLDASGLAQYAVRLNLVDEGQARECLDELEPGNSTPEAVLRVFERKAYLTPWQGAKLLKGDFDGYFLGGYRMLYRIAAGTFGRVYRADNPHTGEVVAIKVLRRKWSNDAHKIELFEREGKVGLSLRHANIVQILAVSRDGSTGQYYIVMEFVEGGNLRDILNIRKKLEPQEALRILEETAHGLAYAYTRGLTHRDIKATNILLSTTGEAKLVDFGLAEITGPSSASQESDDIEIDRTVDYAGLERATSVKAGDVRSDIYFLGCTFFEMITGRPLLTVTRDPKARMMKHRFEVSSKLSRDDPDLPPPIRKLIAHMTPFDPMERYQYPSQLVDAIKQARQELVGKLATDRGPIGPPTVFVVEHHPKLQDAFRDKLKQMGYRVLISIDATRALQRYVQQPYHALIIDVGTAGEEGLEAMEKVMRESTLQSLKCAGFVILSEDQADWQWKAEQIPNTTVRVRPVTMKQMTELLEERVPFEDGTDESD
jgi:serine/threonine protein kinase